MTPVPPIYNQLLVPDADSREFCGETCDAMAASAYGRITSPEEVGTYIRNKYGEPHVQYGTDFVPELADWWTTIGGKWQVCSTIDAALSLGLAMVCIHDNASADPDVNGAYQHFVLVWGHTSQGFQTNNPWGGRVLVYPDTQMVPAIIGIWALWLPQTPTPGDDDMGLPTDYLAAIGHGGDIPTLIDDDVQNIAIDCLGRVLSPNEVQGAVTYIKNNSLAAWRVSCFTSPEAQAFRKKRGW